MSEDKTESPTQKRLDKAREDGDILKSKELGAALVILAVLSPISDLTNVIG